MGTQYFFIRGFILNRTTSEPMKRIDDPDQQQQPTAASDTR